ncbi:hypothetical protein V1280_008608 [Bradyrhizobium sp. AZCC 2230]
MEMLSFNSSALSLRFISVLWEYRSEMSCFDLLSGRAGEEKKLAFDPRASADS